MWHKTKFQRMFYFLHQGVNLADKGDAKGQQYNTPEHVFKNLHTDFVIVGRGILNLKMLKNLQNSTN